MPPTNPKKMGTVLTPSTHPLKALRADFVPPKSYTELYKSGLLLPARNQGSCGSCWAFSVTGVLADRISIATKGAVKEPIAAQYLVSCDKDQFEQQCNGTTNLASAYDHATGDITEDEFGSSPIKGIPRTSEVPYVSGTGETPPSCDALKNITTLYKFNKPVLSLCSTDDESMKIVSKDDLEKNIKRMKQDIMESGSISGAYWVFSDLQQITDFSKPYRHAEGTTIVGGHAIVIVGWDVDEGGEYWIIKNSWGTSWGKNGYYFHYMRDGFEGGADQYSGMELGGHSAIPDMSWYTGDKSGKPPAPSSGGGSVPKDVPPTNPPIPNSPPKDCSTCPLPSCPILPCPPSSCPMCPLPPSQSGSVLLTDPWFWVSIVFLFLFISLMIFIIYKLKIVKN